MSKTLRKSHINTTFSGTTLVCGLIIQQKLYVANLGDSRTIMARQSDKSEDILEPIQLSKDHKPDLYEEKLRIDAAGGRVKPLPGPPGEVKTICFFCCDFFLHAYSHI